MEIQNRLEIALNMRAMKQTELCELTGLKKSSVNGYVKQKWQPKQEALYKMAKVLDVSPMWLAGYNIKGLPETVDLFDVKSNILIEIYNKMENMNAEQLSVISSIINYMQKNKEGK